MHYVTHQRAESGVLINKWLRRVYTAGFVFFLVKGLVWTIVAVLVIY